MESTFTLNKYGAQLWTREKAKAIRQDAEKALDDLNASDVLVIDLKGVEVFDFSFANELFCRLALNLPRDYPGRFVTVENLTGYAEENLQKALEAVGVAMIKRKGQTLSLLGKIHPADESTFSAIRKHKKQVTAVDLAEKLQVNLTAMNERLSKLTSMGLVRREKVASPAGREQYVYSVLS
jgi:predicted transcriptional regulator